MSSMFENFSRLSEYNIQLVQTDKKANKHKHIKRKTYREI